jgi:hypothetical protein
VRLKGTSEFGERLKALALNEETLGKVERLLGEAAGEFPCLSCPSKDECGSFKWFLKWFGAPK